MIGVAGVDGHDNEAPSRGQAWLGSVEGEVYGLVNSGLALPHELEDPSEWWIHVLAVAFQSMVMPPENASLLGATSVDWDVMFEELHEAPRIATELAIDGAPVQALSVTYAGLRLVLARDHSQWPVVIARTAHAAGPWPALMTLDDPMTTTCRRLEPPLG